MQLDKTTFSLAAAYILGLSPVAKIKGTSRELETFSSVLESSRGLHKLLQGNATANIVSEALADKSEKAKTFRHVFDQTWPF